MSRPHHYVFGHIALPQIFFHDPPGFVGALLHDGERLLRQIWDDVGSKVEGSQEGAVRLPPEGLTLTAREIGEGTVAVIISLPRPEQVTEAHFVGLILGSPCGTRDEAPERETLLARYITLEYGLDLSEVKPRTVLCEWSNGRHLNRGGGPEATIEAFADELSEMVQQ